MIIRSTVPVPSCLPYGAEGRGDKNVGAVVKGLNNAQAVVTAGLVNETPRFQHLFCWRVGASCFFLWGVFTALSGHLISGAAKPHGPCSQGPAHLSRIGLRSRLAFLLLVIQLHTRRLSHVANSAIEHQALPSEVSFSLHTQHTHV